MAAIIDEETRRLDEKHVDYEAMLSKWQFWGSAYEGEEEFLKIVLAQNSRESNDNFQSRLNEGEVFNYCATIVDLFSRFLSQQQIHRDLGKLFQDELWQMFWKDIDLYGTDYDVFWNSAEKLASVYGVVGILVDKPKGIKATDNSIVTKADEIGNQSYPYCSLFIPENIHDWQFTRNPITARPELTYLKLKETDGYLAWTLNEWERWTLKPGFQSEYEKTDEGVNPLNEIPFVWFTNYTNLKKPRLGISDIKGVARIQSAITRDLSNGSEIIKYAAFPMMRKPMVSASAEPSQDDDVSGVTAILEFDPDLPHSKPDWLEAKVKEPIDAILKWLDKKVAEIYRNAHLSNIHGQAQSSEARSGLALKYECQQLSSSLSAKGNDMDEAELKMIRLWLKWQNMETMFKDIVVSRLSSFSIDDLSIQLDHCLIATTIVQTDTFKKVLRKKVARLILPDETGATMAAIDEEIDSAKESVDIFEAPAEKKIIKEEK